MSLQSSASGRRFSSDFRGKETRTGRNVCFKHVRIPCDEKWSRKSAFSLHENRVGKNRPQSDEPLISERLNGRIACTYISVPRSLCQPAFGAQSVHPSRSHLNPCKHHEDTSFPSNLKLTNLNSEKTVTLHNNSNSNSRF